MKRRGLLLMWAVIVGWPGAGVAALIVDPPKAITHRVTVQIIETALDNGTSPATIFGNTTQRASIEAGIDSIWAQAGIDIAFLSTITRYNNTFAYQGNGGTRPSGDLDRIISAAGVVMNPDPAIINMFFVNIVPGFPFTTESTANGIGNLGVDGIAQFVGDSLLTFQNGRDVIAGVVAHEIGHNLGLKHTSDGGANLMSPQGTTAQLTAAQISAVFQTTFRNDSLAYIPSGGTGFPRLVPVVIDLLGDYNRDGTVNAADYAVWRNTIGSTANLAADGNGNGVIDAGDHSVWRSRFGTTYAAGQILLSSVPEPTALANLVVAVVLLLVGAARGARPS